MATTNTQSRGESGTKTTTMTETTGGGMTDTAGRVADSVAGAAGELTARLPEVAQSTQGLVMEATRAVQRGSDPTLQIIDDGAGKTLCASSSRVVCGEYGGTVAHATKVGSDLAEKAKALSISKVRFDRGRYRFHGRIKALAEAARKSGLEF